MFGRHWSQADQRLRPVKWKPLPGVSTFCHLWEALKALDGGTREGCCSFLPADTGGSKPFAQGEDLCFGF